MEPIDRFFQAPDDSFFLFGPRGTGKSTLTKQLWPEAYFIDLLDPELFRQFSAHPEHLKEKVLALPKIKTIVIDEIQKVPPLLDVVHSLIEMKKGWQFILTGSSSRKLKRTGVDLLAGRALLYSLHPFMASELGNHFSLDTALQQGMLPIVHDSKTPLKVLKTYIALYLKEEVQMEGLVRQIGNFTRFLEAISFSHASLLNVSHVSRECQVERKVVENYIHVLEDLLLGFRLKIFSKRTKRALIKQTKFYLFDAGVYRSLRPKGPLDRPEEIEGHALEGFLLQHLRAWIDYSQNEFSLYFWRTRSGVEVDFILYGAKGIYALEVKNTNKIYPKDLKNLKSFKEDYPESKLIFLYRGKERLQKGEILCIPIDSFLLNLTPGKFIESIL